MKSRTAATVVLCLMMAGLNSAAAFGGERNYIRIQGFLGISSPLKDTLGSGLWSSFGFSFPVQKKLALSFDFGHWKSEVAASPGAFMNGTAYVNPFVVSAQYFLLPERAFTPYVFLGGGFVFDRFKLGDIFTIPEITISQKLKNGPGGKIGLGFEANLNESVSIVLEFYYFYMTTQATTTVEDMNFGSSAENFRVNLNSLIVHLGFRYTMH